MTHPHHESTDIGPEDEPRLFFEGIDLFNRGQWFDAHEAWEDIWHLAEGSKKRFYQGLIQCAVTLEHYRRGNPRGVRNVWHTCQTKFVGLPDHYMGFEIPRLLGDMKSAIAPILNLPPHRFAPHLPHGQNLPLNRNAIPHLDPTPNPFPDHPR